MSVKRIKQLIEMIESDNFVINEDIRNLELDRETLENIFNPDNNKLSAGEKLLKNLGVKDNTATGLLSQLQANRIEIDDIVDSVLGSRNYLILTGNLDLEKDSGNIADFPSPFNNVMEKIYEIMKDKSILYPEVLDSSLSPIDGYKYTKINNNKFEFKFNNSDNLNATFKVGKNKNGKNDLKNIESISLKRNQNQDAGKFTEVYQKLKDLENNSGYWKSAVLSNNNEIDLIF